MYSVIIISSFLQWNSITSTHSSHQFQALWQCLFSDFWGKKVDVSGEVLPAAEPRGMSGGCPVPTGAARGHNEPHSRWTAGAGAL